MGIIKDSVISEGMDVKVKKGGCASQAQKSEKEMSNIRKGPWTAEEDTILVNYMATHGEGRWNSVARCSDLKRSGKSCRLRWLNYLRPDVRRGNITLQEQILILDLHSRWGNRWSKIAQHLPGRTDNEIKNYWRTRVLKQAKQLKCDVNSKQFKDAMRCVWIPRLLERVRPATESLAPQTRVDPNPNGAGLLHLHQKGLQLHSSDSGTEWLTHPNHPSCGSGTSSSSYSSSVDFHNHTSELLGHDVSDHSHENGSELCPNFNNQFLAQGNGGGSGADSLESLWNEENIWFLQQQLCDDPEIKYNFLA